MVALEFEHRRRNSVAAARPEEATQRLLAPLGYRPPAEYEAQYHRTQAAQAALRALSQPGLRESRGGSARSLQYGVSQWVVPVPTQTDGGALPTSCGC